ncbi:fibrobacter succinogenes major paralogous domain-containing protein [Chlorobaculum tepidum]|nr:fibrobacter succinogenes major paralogous domain-containing protein [Chlorobaculum tepidum]
MIGCGALPSGARRDADGVSLMLGQFARFWTFTPASNGKALARAFGFYDNALRGGEVGPGNGFAVRCVKD